MRDLLFQYCPKLAVLSRDGRSVLLCRRKGEQDYDGVFSLIGGKMERNDKSIVDALTREKTEEVGPAFRLKVLAPFSVDISFVKKDGNYMILPHFLAWHVDGDIVLSDEYSEHAWVGLPELPGYEPKVDNISWVVPALLRLQSLVVEQDYVEI